MAVTGIKIPEIKIAALDDNHDLVENYHTVEIIDRGDAIICCDPEAVDYWGECGREPSYIHEKLEAWADANGYYWDWETPENIILREA